MAAPEFNPRKRSKDVGDEQAEVGPLSEKDKEKIQLDPSLKPGYYPNKNGQAVSDSGVFGKTQKAMGAVIERIALLVFAGLNEVDALAAAEALKFKIWRQRQVDAMFLALPLKFLEYIYRALNNRRVDLAREAKSAERWFGRKAVDDVLANIVDATRLTAEEQMEWDEIVALLWREVGKLPEPLQIALTLHIIDGNTLEKTGAILNIHFSSVHQRVGNALDLLRGPIGSYMRGEL